MSASLETQPSPATAYWARMILLQVGVVAVTWFGCETYRVLLGDNIHVVVPGKIYRGAQRNPEEMTNLVDQYGIRTVINLRGTCCTLPWYVAQARKVQQLGINQEDLCFSAGRMPPKQEMRRLVEVLDSAEKPIYIHCRRGSDRTGLACATALLLEPDTTLEAARRQLHWRFGHMPVGRPAYLDLFLDLYEEWLGSKPHDPDSFRRWIAQGYRGAWASYEAEEFRRLTPAGAVKRGEALAYRVHLRNTGSGTWTLNPLLRAGYHLAYRIRDVNGKPVAEGKSAMLEKKVAPGECLEATLLVTDVLKPGQYRLTVDMIEEDHGWFYQFGAEPLEEEFVIRE